MGGDRDTSTRNHRNEDFGGIIGCYMLGRMDKTIIL